MTDCLLESPEVLLMAWKGARLRELRELRGYTQSDLAEESGIVQANISRWETDRSRPGFEDVMALADALRVSCEAFRQPVGQPPLRSRKIDDEPADDTGSE